ncbi:bifunctional phosphopantothenoylcysteine decarboxylase/phosphopantothenate--cysteine ligase CoaBC [Thermocrinis sp.]
MAKILLGVSSSVAIYKACELLRELKRRGHQVRVVLTPNAEKFVSKLTFHSLSGHKAYSDWEEDPFLHINLPRWCDLFLIAPCSAHTLSKIALGLADNLLTNCVLAHAGPLMIAPACNVEMWNSPPLQENIKKLRERHVVVIEPEEGVLACEEEGKGRLASLERLLDWVEWGLRQKPLSGKKVLITVGATREFIDKVRFISNQSSGKTGFAIARVLWWYGADVEIVAGYTEEKPPPEIKTVRVVSAEEMLKAVLERLEDIDLLVMNAAVSDYRPSERFEGKLKKSHSLELSLIKNPDILEEVAKLKPKNLRVVGFALEEESVLLQNAEEKLRKKDLDLLVANPIDTMGKESHRGYLLFKDGRKIPFSFGEKLGFAEFLVSHLV